MPSFSDESFDILAFSQLAFDIGTPIPINDGIDSDIIDTELCDSVAIDSEPI